MSIASTGEVSAVVNRLLCGTLLDSIRVFSVVVQLCFVRAADSSQLPGKVWVVASGRLLASAPETRLELENASDFFEQRAEVLGRLYQLIGQEVSAADVSSMGTLEIRLGDSRISARSDQADLEEVWAVMSDSPDAFAAHAWYVSLDDAGRLSARSPG